MLLTHRNISTDKSLDVGGSDCNTKPVYLGKEGIAGEKKTFSLLTGLIS